MKKIEKTQNNLMLRGCRLSSLRSFRGKVHESNNSQNQSKLKKEQTPVNSNIINIHLTSLNSRIPSIKDSIANVNPASANTIRNTSTVEAKSPKTNEPIDNLEISKQYFANSSLWRFVINGTILNNIGFVNI